MGRRRGGGRGAGGRRGAAGRRGRPGSSPAHAPGPLPLTQPLPQEEHQAIDIGDRIHLRVLPPVAIELTHKQVCFRGGLDPGLAGLGQL